MTNRIEQIDKSGATWKIEIYVDRSCIDCIVDAGDDDMGGVAINRFDRCISVYNYEIIDRETCESEGNHA